jgi:hypothetical protein
MTTVQITLPDELAQEAERAGLLSAGQLEKLLRDRLRAKKTDELFRAMELMDAADEPAELSPEAVAEEIRTARAERRAKN